MSKFTHQLRWCYT